MNNLREVGKIASPFGLKGAFKVMPSVDKNEQFFEFTEMFIFGMSDSFEIEDVWTKKKSLYVKLRGVDSIDEIEKRIGYSIYVSEDEYENSLQDGRFFVNDLIGIKVFVGEKEIGEVRDVINGPVQDIFVITNGEDEAMVPFVKAFFEDVDTKSMRVNFKPVEGLIPWI